MDQGLLRTAQTPSRLVVATFHRPYLAAFVLALCACADDVGRGVAADGAYHVHPGDDLQAMVERAARDPDRRHVKVHAGVYRPPRKSQALLWLVERHDGLLVEAVGDVTLTAANPALSNPADPGYPAVVNHVVYFGDGITQSTVLRGFKITGANNFVTQEEQTPPMQPDVSAPGLDKELFFYTDGGGIKIFGRSYPTIEQVEVHDNYSSPCGAGVSIEHRGYRDEAVVLRDCIFRNNRCPVSGSAVDLLRGSAAIIENCLFVGNLSGEPLDARSEAAGTWKPEHGCGALTVFPKSRLTVRRCTFTGNRNGVDDSTSKSVYADCIFWHNDAAGGWPEGRRYEIDIREGAGVQGCFLQGETPDLQGEVDPARNVVGCADPDFDRTFRPRAPGFERAGYRP